MSSAPKKRRIDALGEAIEQAKAELDEREASLERREEQLKKAIEGVDHEKKLMAGRAPSDVLQLNIGGSHCSVSRRTLCQYEPSLLAAKFSGRWDDNVEKDADGRFFIDQPSHLFMPLVDFRYEPYDNPNPNLNPNPNPNPHPNPDPDPNQVDFLRAKAIETPNAAPACPPAIGEDTTEEGKSNHRAKSDFRRMLKFYGMTPFVYQLAVSLHRGQPGTASFVSGMEVWAGRGRA